MDNDPEIWDTSPVVMTVQGEWFSVAVRTVAIDDKPGYRFRAAIWLGVPTALRRADMVMWVEAEDRSTAVGNALAWCYRRHRLGPGAVESNVPR